MHCKTVPFTITLAACCGALLFASADWRKTNPSQWTGDDVYKILNDSPWSKQVKPSFSSSGRDQLASSQGQSDGTLTNNPQLPAVGRGRMGGGYGNSRTYSSGQGANSQKTSKPVNLPTVVTIQWQSALPVQIAAAKKADEHADISKIKPDYKNYVIALIGLPLVAVGGRAASIDSDQTIDRQESEQIENRLIGSTQLIREDREPLHPVRVELNQGVDGRILLYFPASDPITTKEKSIEFKLNTGPTKIEKKFSVKEMEFHGRLAL